MICPKCGGLALYQERAENGIDFIGCVMPGCRHEWTETRPRLTADEWRALVERCDRKRADRRRQT